MIKIVLNGCSGKMGKIITECATNFKGVEIVGGIDRFSGQHSYPVYATPQDLDIDYDVLLDFSRADALSGLLELTEKTNKPLVICSTGFSDEQLALIDTKSKTLPLFRSANMSLGINLINSLLRKVTPLLYGNYDIEIIEKHHNQKVDAPSGTAILLADTIKDSIKDETKYVYGREGSSKREENEIGIHAVRGGSIVGDHDVIFAGTGEVIELTHKAISREVFAIGALKACEYMATVTNPGLYNMDNVIGIEK
ncbi:4-hydroxy-tetrahydrodipicolinate reductase [Clostridium saccharobutylicum]|uniref:4-hydroxy-tetrahydrodipicolinate reductase n=1 Tax=Clostridium saccharobutylicum DSM 13864 TaxID=1345695 RepID=U5MW89_CLOSA|nr:4-hydroxy-tetrahydrodipicolinate reductase [Clostridium saccharobutylicum]AGX43722.1 4-hydroxy-tetrahydrodipicolinate reductase DapB [Clostridium saccharobutylicum DSM 13864]AQR91020.1 4-hydroxy-tetrahydrodipicolinate reductase [Clostridium saccharobutylicum]AQS00924.1 4-hydroxy-tetrahydrodipicolinate reductase [Clostridium saccharobutylicum]AQS10662.1 4-hydroxy-tetrahydrodipicolinate reductase [Clostridium saccharobutylicum]AQS14907.1 4-hydroxy-tetrahydrodipicolinate reductase [Clostridium